MLDALHRLSGRIECVERIAVRAFVLALPVMILANTLGRAMRSPIYWMDELAIHCMVWLAMIGLSLTLKTRSAVAVTMLVDAVAPGLMKGMRVVVDLIILAFALTLLFLCMRWFDPVMLARAGFDLHEFSGQTFNFMYQDTTATLGMRKFWFWLIVPVVALTTSVHAASNLARTVSAPATALKAKLASAGSRGLD
ncbi:TRAP transporter small permease subunit [Orrella sp. JC864]|uniref:TRAP transporter small permease n=1 Tax=Orrella sp. JC864 TaxID=3120298 RepID=UPI0030091EC8